MLPNELFESVDRLLGEDEFKRMVNRVQDLSAGESLRLVANSEPTGSSGLTDYELLEIIGQGGMGTVWKARQVEPIQRDLAIKVIHRQFESSVEAVSRFNVERQALARMEHPNIASIVDAGATGEGQPYFAMEFFDGIGLCQFCDENRLSVYQRLQLFNDVCMAVQHAHQKGIIHRDLKPSNVLVKMIDGKPFAKIIDFGLAKTIEESSDLNELANNTSFGQVLGSLRYMSPEQASMRSQHVDTRTDVYSLGIILYELLCGRTPISKETVNEQTLIGIMQSIRQTGTFSKQFRFGKRRTNWPERNWEMTTAKPPSKPRC